MEPIPSDHIRESKIYVGPAGWSYPDWKGIVYPAKKPKGFQELEFISEYFNTVEINVSFYRPVTPSMAESWIKKVNGNPEFFFTLKLWNRFTHKKQEIESQDPVIFKDGIQPLVETGRLGCILVQFPWSFKNNSDNRSWLENIIDEFHEIPLVLEVRHSSWVSADFYSYLKERMVGFCNIDQPIFSNSIKPSAVQTAPTGYIRLHGRNQNNWFRKDAGRDDRYDYYYSEQELGGWVTRIKNVARFSSKTFVITNNHFQGQAIANALQIKYLLEKKKLPVPQSLIKHFPELKKIAENICGQLDLFNI